MEPRVNEDGFRELLVLAKNSEFTIYAGMREVRPGQVVRGSQHRCSGRSRRLSYPVLIDREMRECGCQKRRRDLGAVRANSQVTNIWSASTG